MWSSLIIDIKRGYFLCCLREVSYHYEGSLLYIYAMKKRLGKSQTGDLLCYSRSLQKKELDRASLRYFLSGRAVTTLASNLECRGMLVLKEAK